MSFVYDDIHNLKTPDIYTQCTVINNDDDDDDNDDSNHHHRFQTRTQAAAATPFLTTVGFMRSLRTSLYSQV